MYAILQSTTGGRETLAWQRCDIPQPQAHQLLVRVRAAGVNRADIVQREGRYPAPAGDSPILGLELAGEVVAIGQDVTGFAIGDAVFGLVGGGAYAEYAVLDAACAIHKPEALTWAQAASLPEAWMTAWFNVVEIAQLQAGESLLVHAGASGVGSAAIQLANWLGATAFTTVGSVEKQAYCQALGAKCAVNYHEEDFASVLRTHGRVNVVLDCIGGAYLKQNFSVLANDGRLIVIGLMGGAKTEIDLGLLLMKRIRLMGSTLRAQPLAVKARLSTALAQNILPAILAQNLQLTVDRCFALPEAAEAHDYMERNANLGKIVLVHTPESRISLSK